MTLRFVLILFFTGLRRGDLCRIQANHVDLKGGLLREFESKTNVRSVPICKPLAAVLEPVLAGSLRASDHLVPAGDARGPRKEGNRPRTALERREGFINGLFRRHRLYLRIELRDRFHPHTWRHTLKSYLAEQSVPIPVRDYITGHVSSSVARQYEHCTPSQARMWFAKVMDPLMHLVDPSLPMQNVGS